MTQPWRDPFEVLGVEPGTDQAEVKKRWRELAFKYHPDRDPSPKAAQRFAEVKRAADAILKHGYGSADPVAAGAAAMRYHWAQEGMSTYEYWYNSRKKTGPLWASAALFAGGLIMFGGAIWMFNANSEQQQRGAYNYAMRAAAREGLETPGSSRRQELLELVEEERRQRALRKEREAAAQGHAPSTAISGAGQLQAAPQQQQA